MRRTGFACWLSAVVVLSLGAGCGGGGGGNPPADTGADTVQSETGPEDAGDGAVEETVAPDAGEVIEQDVQGLDATEVIEQDAMDVPATDTGIEMDVVGEIPPTDTGGCTTSSDCMGSPGGPVCDTATRTCVACTTAEDVCLPGNYCNMNRCTAGCRTPADCTGMATRCDTATHTCVGCTADDHCAPGTVCRMNACVPGCTEAHTCGAGSLCCAGICVDTQTDASNCGSCGRACAMGGVCCAGTCATTATDPANCGACGTACSAEHATAGCAAGRCTVAACSTGFGDCDMNAANGCEVDLTASTANCGTCAHACTGGMGGTPRCSMGTCGVACSAGLGDCDGNASNGCESNLQADVTHCGTCTTTCAAGANASASCAMGACLATCNTNFGDCDGMPANGCETDLRTSATNCGACARGCALAHATSGCAASVCTVVSCAAGWADCNHMAADGCEVETGTDRANCGTCGRACGGGDVCSGGMCSTVCRTPLTYCGGRCIDTSVDPNNCGTGSAACGRVCPTGANAVAGCTASTCTLTCFRGYGNCDAMAINGCETDLTTTVAHCGRCTNACTFAHAAATCSGGACAIGTCNAGFGNCDGNPANGCEVNLNTTVTSCGSCGAICSFAHAAAGCTAGVCTLGTCQSGWGNCDSMAANGCETNVTADFNNCGACGRVCGLRQACASGMCVSSCPGGTVYCGGACLSYSNFLTDPANCGGCGRACTAGQSCIAGRCWSTPANDTCTTATPLSLATPSVNFSATTTTANHSLDVPCLGGGVNQGRDLFYSFTLTRREVVYADTFGTSGAGWDTVLFFARATTTGAGCAALPYVASNPDRTCNDDVGTSCSRIYYLSSVYTVLDPGTYFLVVSGYGNGAGTTNVHFEHLPIGGGTATVLGQGARTLSGTTSGTGTVASGTCGGAGPENAYWWPTCPGSGSGALTANTCTTATFDTVLYVMNGNGAGAACDNDGCGMTSTQSRLSVPISGDARLHALFIDGFAGTDAGRYAITVNRP